jgi:hypothetical protein
MRRGALILVLGLLAGCQNPDPPLEKLTVAEINKRFAELPLPPKPLIDRIEMRLAGKPCIGRLDGWLRFYSYELRREFDRRKPVRDMLDTRYIQLELYGSVPGKGTRRVTQPPSSAMNLVTERPKIAWGRYDRTTDTLLVRSCRGTEGDKAPPLENLSF